MGFGDFGGFLVGTKNPPRAGAFLFFVATSYMTFLCAFLRCLSLFFSCRLNQGTCGVVGLSTWTRASSEPETLAVSAEWVPKAVAITASAMIANPAKTFLISFSTYFVFLF